MKAWCEMLECDDVNGLLVWHILGVVSSIYDSWLCPDRLCNYTQLE